MGGKLVLRGDMVEQDVMLPADMRSMMDIKNMGNSILLMVRLEEDYPTKNEDGKLPILNLNVWVTEQQTANTLLFQCYRKPM